VAASEVVRPVFLPRPSKALEQLRSGVTEGWLWPHVRATASVWVAGYLAAVVVGVAIGLLTGLSRTASRIIDPWLTAIYVMPDIAFVPVFILWFGIGFTFKLWFVFLAGVFFVAVNTLAGVRATEGKYVNMASSFGVSQLMLLRTVVLPGSVPHILTGLRQAAGRSLVGVVAAEFVASNVGLGFMTSVAGQTFNTSRVIAGVFILAVAGIAVSEALRFVEGRFETWR
jgi:NitT/TauT family transport system permease protein